MAEAALMLGVWFFCGCIAHKEEANKQMEAFVTAIITSIIINWIYSIPVG